MTDAVNIKINGQEYTDFTQASVTKSIETLAGHFSFTCTSSPNIDFPIKVNSKCEIIVQGEKVINGYIERLRIRYDASTGTGSHGIQVSGRDRTADIQDSTVGGSQSSDFQVGTNGLSLKQFTLNVLKEFNLQDIDVIQKETIEPFKQDVLSIEYGSSAFDFIEKYAKKRQVLLTTDGNGNIVFTRTPTIRYKTALILSRSAPGIILDASVNYNNTKRYNKYIGSSQGNPSGLQQFTTKPLNIASVGSGEIIDNDIRNSRIYHFEPEFSSDQKTLIDRVKWEANFRRVQSEKLSYTVQGHVAEDDSEIWKPGRLVRLTDEFANVLNGVKLISSVMYNFSLREGSTTLLELIPKDAFSLIVNKPENDKAANKGDTQQYISIPLSQAKKAVQEAFKGRSL